MSGRHRVVKPRRRFGLATVLNPVRAVARWARTGRDAAARVWARLVERARDRFEREDPFAGVTLDPQATSPDPVPAPEPIEEPEPAPLSLTPDQVLPVLHTQHPHLPAAHVRWHVYDGGVYGQVNSLDADEGGQRRIVGMYAKALAAPVAEQVDGVHVTVAVAGAFGDQTVTVAAVLLHDDTLPLPVFAETTQDPTLQDDTQSTQALPDELVREVVSA